MVRAALILSLLTVLGAAPASAQERGIETGVDTVYTGAYSDDWAAAGDLGRLAQIGSPLTFGGTFHHPGEGADNTLWILEQIWRAGATPVANLEIFATSYEIAAGHHDEALVEWSVGLRRWLELGEGRSLLLAPLVEMNGDWVIWGMDPGNYRIAFRRIHDIVRSMGVDETMVRFVFGPNSSSTPPFSTSDYWPGEDVVDVVGVSLYNFGGAQWWDPGPVMEPVMHQLRPLAGDKPFLVTQTGSGSAGGDKDRWILDLFDYVADDPHLVGLVYFNFDKESDWRVWDDRAVSWGWLHANSDDRVGYRFPLSEWFRPGAIPFTATAPVVAEADPEPPAPPVFDGASLHRDVVERRILSTVRPL